MDLLRKFAGRTWADKRLLLRSLALVVGVRAGLWVLPYRTVQRLVEAKPGPVPPVSTRDGAPYQRRVVAAVESVGRRLLGDKPCLVQALVAQRLLRQGGYETSLHLGVAKDGRKLLAHAWLERDGYVVIGGGRSQFQYTPLSPVGPDAA
ncbi:MAG: lasso peptide biosynthesis B2 protein [Bacteroidota bacterium]